LRALIRKALSVSGHRTFAPPVQRDFYVLLIRNGCCFSVCNRNEIGQETLIFSSVLLTCNSVLKRFEPRCLGSSVDVK
jgi:hypothetical protein